MRIVLSPPTGPMSEQLTTWRLSVDIMVVYIFDVELIETGNVFVKLEKADYLEVFVFSAHEIGEYRSFCGIHDPEKRFGKGRCESHDGFAV
jgi:hypothetical protein